MNTQNNNYTNNNKNGTHSDNNRTTLPFKIVTHNVQGLNNVTKQKQIIDFMDSNNIGILGLSKTKLNTQCSKQLYKMNEYYDAFFSSIPTPNSKGVGLIISKTYSRFIQRVKGHDGRVIYVDMYLKGRIKLRVIQVYLHANLAGNKEELLSLHKYVVDLIHKSQNEHYRIVLMGDFNVDPKHYLHALNTTGSFQWKYSIIHSLISKNLTDVTALCHDVSTTAPYDTFYPVQQNYNSSRIDLIWISRDLILETLSNSTFSVDLYNSDHHAVSVSFLPDKIFKCKNIAKLKQQLARKGSIRMKV
jgi:exonuclease III